MSDGAAARTTAGAGWVRWLAVGAFVLVCQQFLVQAAVQAGRLGPPLDDGWIYMAFARALAEGQGITYAGHDGVVTAVTGPIWCALLAAGMAVAGAEFWVVALLGVATGAVAVLGVHRLARAAGLEPRLAGAAAVLFAVTPRFAWGSLSGMEVPFYVAATVWGLALHLEGRDRGAVGWAWRAALPLALAGYARPECLVLPLLAALHRRRLDGLISAAVLVAVYPLYHLVVSGHPLPTTFYAKAAGGTPLAVLQSDGASAALEAWASGVGMQLLSFLAWVPSHLPWIALGLLAGLRQGWRQRDGVPFLVAVVLVYGVTRGSLGFATPWFQHGRYFAQLWPLLLVIGLHGFDATRRAWGASLLVAALVVAGFVLEPELAAVLGFDAIWGGLEALPNDLGRVRVGMVLAPAALFGLAAAIGLASPLWGRARPGAPPLVFVVPWMVVAVLLGGHRYGQGVDDTYELNVAMAEQVRAHVPPGETVACHDIGALGFFAERPLLDLAGLGSPDVAFRAGGSGVPSARRAVLAERRPRWLCATESMLDALNPAGAGLPPGLVGVRPVAHVHAPDNVTVLGNRYWLVELQWQDG